MSRHPEVKWAERLDKVYITVQLADATNVKVNLEPDGVFTCSATAGADGYVYEIKLDLHDKVNVEDSKLNTGVRNIFCVLEKAEKGWWKKLLRGDVKTPHYVKVDWDKWVDEDDDNNDTGNLNMGGMDFSNFANMGAMGGMGGMDMGALGGMGGMDMGAMGGMGGMDMGALGGMGGMDMGAMGGMGGMDDDLDDTDDEEQAPLRTEGAGKADEVSSEVKTEAAPST